MPLISYLCSNLAKEMRFTLQAKDKSGTAARCGVMETDHGRIETPIFMPVGTVGSVKGVYHRDLEEDIGAEIILGNTYHLYLRPGLDILSQAGGLHKFISWDKPILTDSGGYQVFSLAQCRKLTDEGYEFQSHIDGSRHIFTPENNIDIQRIIGADIIMALDECCPGEADYKYASDSLDLTLKWLKRCIARFDGTEPLYGHHQAFFPIVQGCIYPDLRRKAAEELTALDREGYAIGGLSVGEPTELMYQMIEEVHPILPRDKPRYLMGVGTPANILEAIARGIDMFDCVMPTRNGRNGMLFTSEGIINIRNRKWAEDFSPIDPDGTSFVDRRYTKAYLRHLFIAGEMLGAQIASEHNLAFYLNLVRMAREHILKGDFNSWKCAMVTKLQTRL
jgi:queuine tRNA-ribosyltransferase